MASQNPISSDYPVHSKQMAGLVDGLNTEVMVLPFSDKIMITISQEGKLAQWMQVKLDPNSPARGENFLPSSEDSMLPLSNLTAVPLLGGGHSERQMIGQLYASQLASLVVSKNPEESRTVLVGLGLSKIEANQTQYLDLLELVTRCL